MSDFRVKDAFEEVREGRSPEYVICDPTLNAVFLAAARRLGVDVPDAGINSSLLNLRKRGLLADCPTTRRKSPDPNLKRYRNAVLNTARLVEKQFRKNVDEIVCDPDTRAQFDAFIQFMCPGTSAFEAQYAALSLRKTSRLKPESVGHVIRSVSSSVFDLVGLEGRLVELPTGPGVYIFFDEDVTLYAGKADNLSKRVGGHISTWTFRDLVRQIAAGVRHQIFLVYHELSVNITARELAAYETELIRSRDPEHNRSGKDRK